jgi:chorismate synthase
LFRVTSFGESHGRCIGVVVDGCSAGHRLDLKQVQAELDRRRPGQSDISTPRQEPDRVEVLSGVFNGFTTGAPICMLIWNKDRDSSKYEELIWTPRPGHADYTAWIRYGGYQDYRGGGRFSGRITAGFVMAGALAKQVLSTAGIEVLGYTQQIGEVSVGEVTLQEVRKRAETSIVRCPDSEASEKMEKEIRDALDTGDSVGGKVRCIGLNIPTGLGQPVFDTLEGDLSKAFMAIPGVKAVEFGAGVLHAPMRGSESNDSLRLKDGKVISCSNHAGGIQGGLSNGMPITCTITFKPTPSISKPQLTVNLKKETETTIMAQGRHDPCIVPRAVPVVESMMALVLLDHMMLRGKIKEVLGEE